MNKASIQTIMHLPYAIDREDDLYVATCPILDVVSQGETPKEALANLVEAITLFIKTCQDMGTLGQVLADCGFVPAADVSEAAMTGNSDTIDVPVSLLVARQHAQNHVS